MLADALGVVCGGFVVGGGVDAAPHEGGGVIGLRSRGD